MFLDFRNEGNSTDMIGKKHALVNELTSPLQRIMWIYNADDPDKRTFENNICAFHIGKGYFLTVAHNLRLQAGYYKSISQDIYRKELHPILDGSQTRFLDQHYFTDDYTGRKHLNTSDPSILQQISAILKQKRFDTRWVTLAGKKICRPHLLLQFRNNSFFNDPSLTHHFASHNLMYEKAIQKYNFLVEVELVKAFYSADIALYRIVNTAPELVEKIPAADLNFDFLDDSTEKLYCLQSAPSGPSGRLLNTATIEGILDHFNLFNDDIGGNYTFEGYRYLVKGYFRFGSSGAPYFLYDNDKQKFVVNAVQSEASGIQLSIGNSMDGNFQYVNAIVSPLSIIRNELQQIIGS